MTFGKIHSRNDLSLAPRPVFILSNILLGPTVGRHPGASRARALRTSLVLHTVTPETESVVGRFFAPCKVSDYQWYRGGAKEGTGREKRNP